MNCLKIKELEIRWNQERRESEKNVAQAYKLWFYRVDQILGVMQTMTNQDKKERDRK